MLCGLHLPFLRVVTSHFGREQGFFDVAPRADPKLWSTTTTTPSRTWRVGGPSFLLVVSSPPPFLLGQFGGPGLLANHSLGRSKMYVSVSQARSGLLITRRLSLFDYAGGRSMCKSWAPPHPISSSIAIPIRQMTFYKPWEIFSPFFVVRVVLSSKNIYPFLGLVRRDRCLKNPILCLTAGRGLVGVSGESRQGAGSPDSQVLRTEYTVGISIGKQGMNFKDNAYCGDVTKKNQKKKTEKSLHVVHEQNGWQPRRCPRWEAVIVHANNTHDTLTTNKRPPPMRGTGGFANVTKKKKRALWYTVTYGSAPLKPTFSKPASCSCPSTPGQGLPRVGLLLVRRWTVSSGRS